MNWRIYIYTQIHSYSNSHFCWDWIIQIIFVKNFIKLKILHKWRFISILNFKDDFLKNNLNIYTFYTYLAFIRLMHNQSLPGSPGPGIPGLSKSYASSMMPGSTCTGSQDSISTFFLPLSQENRLLNYWVLCKM